MILDLQKAYQYLPDSWSGADSGRMSKWAAKALEAKIHMFEKNWQVCWRPVLILLIILHIL